MLFNNTFLYIQGDIFGLSWLKTVSITFQDLDFDVSL